MKPQPVTPGTSDRLSRRSLAIVNDPVRLEGRLGHTKNGRKCTFQVYDNTLGYMGCQLGEGRCHITAGSANSAAECNVITGAPRLNEDAKKLLQRTYTAEIPPYEQNTHALTI